MLHLNTHNSIDEPPDKPFSRGRKRPAAATVGSHSPQGKVPDSKRSTLSSGVSPGWKINIRSDLINQLDKWHKLLDSSVITQEEYDALKGKILSDINEL